MCSVLIISGSSGVAWANVATPQDSPEAMLSYIEQAQGSWYTGSLDYLTKSSLTLSDTNHWFAEKPLFISKYGHNVSRGFFSEGDTVKVLLNRDGKCVMMVRL